MQEIFNDTPRRGIHEPFGYSARVLACAACFAAGVRGVTLTRTFQSISLESGVSRPGNNIKVLRFTSVTPAAGAAACRAECNGDPLCRAFTYLASTSTCELKGVVPAPASDSSATSGVRLTTEYGIDRWGADYRTAPVTNLDACREACANDATCKAYTYRQDPPACYLKSGRPAPAVNSAFVSGQKPEHAGLREFIHDPTGGLTPPPDTQVSEDLVQHLQKLSAKRNAIWTDPFISVCWEEDDASYASHRVWVQDQVKKTWEANSLVRFTGWKPCSTSGGRIRIAVEDRKDQGPHVKGLGAQLDGKSKGMVLNFTFKNGG